MEICSKVHAKNLVAWAADKPQVVVLSADLTSSTEIDLFKEAYPERFFSLGIAEQNMLSFAGGMSREGFIPLIHTFGVFIYRRAYDQIAMSVAYPNLPVKMFGFLPGILTPGGATHQAIEDIAVMRALPNLTILECADATEVESVLDVAYAVNGPVYIRMLRGEIPRLFPSSQPLVLGQARRLHRGDELTVISSGICTEEALRAIKVLSQRGVRIEHLHISTLKPFNDPVVKKTLSRSQLGVITLENHSVIGGLGSAVAELMAEIGCQHPLIRLGIQDTFLHGASRPYLAREYGLDALALVRAVEKLTKRQFKIEAAELASIHLEPMHSDAKAEAL